MTSTYTGYIRDDDDTPGSILANVQAGKINARGASSGNHAVANVPNGARANPGNSSQTAVADAFDAAAFDALPLRDKLDKAAHASLAFKMALIASTDVATASDARIKAALSAAQSVILTKARVAEVELAHVAGPDRTAEHLARWEKLKRESEVERERENAARASQPVIAGSTSAINGNS